MIRWAYAASFVVSVLLFAVVGLLGSAGASQATGEIRDPEPAQLVGGILLWAWAFACVALAIAAIVDAIVLAVRGDVRALAQGALVVKLAAIPWFVMNFLASVFATMVLSIIPGAGLLGVLFVPFTWLVMLPTSAYGIAALIRMRVDGDQGWVALALLLPMHLVFVLDVIASIVVAILARGARGARGDVLIGTADHDAWRRAALAAEHGAHEPPAPSVARQPPFQP